MPILTLRQRRIALAVAMHGLGIGLVAAATVVTAWMRPGTLIAPLFFLAVMVAAWFGGIGPGLVTALVASQAINYFFLPPLYTFTFDLVELPQLLSFLLAAGLVTWWVAARKRAEEELRKSEFRYRNIFEAMAVSFWDLDFTGVGNLLRQWKASGVTDLRRYLAENPKLVREAMAATIALDVNEKSVRLFRAKDRESLLGPTDRFWPPQSEWVYVESVIAAVTGKPSFEAECEMLTADGQPFDALFTVSFPSGTVGRGRILVGIVDMSERNRALTELQRVQGELAHAARVSTLGELSASIAHEVNQPLAAIVTSGEASLRWLARETPDLERARNALGRIVNDGKRAAEVLARIRALATKASPERVSLRCNEVITDSTALVRREVVVHDIDLKLDLAPEIPEVKADRIQLQQVLINLLVNAIQAMAENGSGARELVVRSRSSNAAVVVEVDDTGPGIPPDRAQRVFDPFYTTKARGMGMGLSICRSIIEAHGGEIAVRPKPDAGTVFRFTLPAGEA